jgi:class 3 adenylate cyclase/predicted ATPase
VATVQQWLEDLGLGQYAEVFADNAVDLDVLAELSDADLESLGILLGDRKRLLRAIASLGDDGVGVRADPAAPAQPSSPRVRAQAERRQLTVMFCDLVGSTAMSQRLDPEDLGDVIRAYQDACTGVIVRLGGYVARYMGDGVLAYFGYPTAYEDNAERAVRAGLDVVSAVGRLRVRPELELQVRIGIATGPVVVGEIIGEGAAEESAVLGETPNLAARLQGIADANQVVIDETTRRLTGRQFTLEDLGPQTLKGIAEPVPGWCAVAEQATATRFDARGPRLTRFVGRTAELQLLLERWQQACDGEGQVAFLSGEAGIGKSRLVQALQDRIAADTHVRIRYQCSPYHTNSALYPIVQQLEWAARILPDDADMVRLDKLEALLRPTTDDLEAAVPYLAKLLSLPFADRYGSVEQTPQQQKEGVFAALTNQLIALAASRPVCMVFEDAHWIDPTTHELLNHLSGQIAARPVLVVVTHRPDWRDAAIGGHGHVVSLSLGRLGRTDVGEIVRTILGARADRDLVERIAARTDGVPLFIEELTRSVQESAEIEAGAKAEIPASLQASLLSRLDRLGEAKEVAQIGAVIGRQFPHDLLRAVAGRAEAELSAALDRLLAAQLVFRRGDPPEATYTFKHALVQDAAYESLLKRKRQQLHLRIAEALERIAPNRGEAEPELLAHHYTEAGRTEPAIRYWRRAGERAAQRSANVEAMAHFRKALDLLAGLPPSVERDAQELDLLLSLAGALIIAEGYTTPEAGPVYARAWDLCDALGETDRMFPTLYGRFVSNIVDGRVDAAAELAQEFMRRAEGEDDVRLRLLGHRVLAPALFAAGRFRSAQDHCRRGHALYDPERDADLPLRYGTDVKAFLSWVEGEILWSLGFPDQALRRMASGMEWAQEIDHPNTLGLMYGWGGTLLFSVCRMPERVREYAEHAMAIAVKHDVRQWTVVARPFLYSARLAEDPDAQLIASLRKSIEALEQHRSMLFFPFHVTALADAERRAGALEMALVTIDRASAHMDGGGERWWEAEVLRVRGEILRDLTRLPEAENECRRALEVARAQDAKSLELRAAVSLARFREHQSRRAEARDIVAPVYGWFSEGFETPDLIDAKALLDALA